MSSAHRDDMFQQVHESLSMRSDNVSPLCFGSRPSLDSTAGERRNKSKSLLDLIDETLAILEDVNDDNNNGLGSPF